MAGITLLPNGDEILVYGKQLEYMYVYSLAEGRQVEKYKTGKGIVMWSYQQIKTIICC